MNIRACFLRLERDNEYRARVLKACPNAFLRDRARLSAGTDLDSVGGFVAVPRRIIEDVA